MATPDRLLEDGQIVLLDGGVGSEIQRRGVAPDNKAWSGASHVQHPDVVLQIHRDYVAAGADVITANTFASAPHILERMGLGESFEAINRSAIELAQRARDETESADLWIAGAMSTIPPADRPDAVPAGAEVADNLHRQADVLARAGADLLLAEMMLDSASATIILDACLDTGLPVWVGISASFGSDGKSLQAFRAPGKYTAMRDEPLEDLMATVLSKGVAVAGVMHTKLPVMEPALAVLNRFWCGPKMAYAETGRAGIHDWSFDEAVPPDSYAAAARNWIGGFGVQIVGGCCGTGPEHIRELNRTIRTV